VEKENRMKRKIFLSEIVK